MNFIPEEINAYAEAHSSAESEVLRNLNRETHLKVMQPRMLSGHLQGRFLSLLSKLVKPQRILEIGTYTGYSAICLAEGLAETGILITIDNNVERAALVDRYIRDAGFAEKIQPVIGEAEKLIPEIKGNFDLVFIDADKSNYPLYYQLLKDRINPGGLLIADNVLWSGKVTRNVEKKDIDTAALLKFNSLIQQDNTFENVLLPVRDGLMVARHL